MTPTIDRDNLTGQIWELAFSNLEAVVVCEWTSDGEPPALRVVPLESGAPARAFATNRDVLLPAHSTDRGEITVAHPWAAQTIAADDLARPVGRVKPDALRMLREAELIGIAPATAPELETWLGTTVANPQTDDAMRRLLDAWNDALDMCELFRHVEPAEMGRAAFRPKLPREVFTTMGPEVEAEWRTTGEIAIPGGAAHDRRLAEAA